MTSMNLDDIKLSPNSKGFIYVMIYFLGIILIKYHLFYFLQNN